MLKKAKLFIAICLLLSFAQAPPNKAFATETTSQSQVTAQKDYTVIKNYAQKFFNNQNGKGTLNDPIELYNLSNSLQALFFSSNQGGYLIVNLVDYSIPEFSTVDENPYIIGNNKKHFYNGPLFYLEEDNNGQVINSKSKQKLGNLKDLKDHDIFQERNKNKPINSSEDLIPPKNSDLLIGTNTANSTYSLTNFEGILATTSSTTKYTYLKNTLPNYSYNPDGRCFVTASAMMLAYYDLYYNKNFIPTNLESSNGTKLIDYLVNNYIPLNCSSGTSLKGLQNYVKAQNVGYSVVQTPTSNPFDPNVAMNCINNNKPFIVQLTNDSKSSDGIYTYGNHEVAAHGYATVQVGTASPYYKYTLINDGWGHTSEWVDISYSSYITYIK